MQAKLIDIGNSKGVIIPAKLIKLIGLDKNVSIDVKDDLIILSRPEKKIRQGWEEMIRKEVAENGQPKPLMPDIFEDEDNSDWTW